MKEGNILTKKDFREPRQLWKQLISYYLYHHEKTLKSNTHHGDIFNNAAFLPPRLLRKNTLQIFYFSTRTGTKQFYQKTTTFIYIFFITIFSYTQETKRFFRSLTDYQILTDRRETFRATNHPKNQDRYIYTYNTFFFILAFCRFKSSLDYSHNAYAQYQPTTPTKNSFHFFLRRRCVA